MRTFKHLFVCALLFSAVATFAQYGGTTGPLTWELTDGTLTISGEGAMPDYDGMYSPWDEHLGSITSVEIGDGVTRIGNRAFIYADVVTSVTIGNSVTAIGDYAFQYCAGLTAITFPSSVASVGTGAFWRCTALTQIAVDEGSPHFSFEDGVLFNKDKSTLVVCLLIKAGEYAIPETVTEINPYAFYGCKLTSVTMPNSVTEIGECAFYGCGEMTSVTLSESITTIPNHAFIYTGLTSAVIPNSVTSVKAFAFSGCEALTSVTSGNSVTEIEDDAFSNCFALTEFINRAAAPQTITEYVFYDVDINACTLKVPAGSIDAYEAAAVWTDFERIEGIDDIPVTGVSLNVETAELNVNETLQLVATVMPEDATDKNVTFSSTNPPVATVDETGLVTAVKAGKAIITVTTADGGLTATCEVTVGNVGISDNTLANITAYGNEGNVYIVNPNNIPLKSVEVLDVLGRVVYDGRGRTFSTPTEEIPVNGASGIYIVRLVSDNGKVLSAKLNLND